jgi:hypothetical protein
MLSRARSRHRDISQSPNLKRQMAIANCGQDLEETAFLWLDYDPHLTSFKKRLPDEDPNLVLKSERLMDVGVEVLIVGWYRKVLE